MRSQTPVLQQRHKSDTARHSCIYPVVFFIFLVIVY